MNLKLYIKKFCRLPLIDDYILKQLSLFFVFSVGLFSALGVTIGTVSDLGYKVTEYKLPILVAIVVFGYKIPEYIAYALPISILLSSLIVYGRLNSDRELTALMSFGISLVRIIVPTLGFSLAIAGTTFLFKESIVPAANYQANLWQNPYIAKTELNLQNQDLFYPEYEIIDRENSTRILKRIYFAEQYRDRTLERLTIVDLNRGEINQIISAKLARWNPNQRSWNLVEGEIHQIDSTTEGVTTKFFQQQQLALPITLFEIATKKRSPEDMNIHQAKEYLNLIQDSGNKIDIAKFEVKIQQKYAFPFICSVFALIGAALGAKYSQINRSQGFGLCVAIVFAYYVLGFVTDSLGVTGILSPFWAAWLPNFLGLLAGIWLLITNN